jgi:hypothetical protein
MSSAVANLFAVPVALVDEMSLVTHAIIVAVRLNFLLVAVLHNALGALQEALVALQEVLLEAQAVLLVAKQRPLLAVSVVVESSAEFVVR